MNDVIERLELLRSEAIQNERTLMAAQELLPNSDDIAKQITFERGRQRGLLQALVSLRNARNAQSSL